MEQQIQFVTAPDGVNLAVATTGSGPPLLIVPGWISHLEFDWTWPQSHDLFDRLARNHLLVRYDKRGTGLSDRYVSDYSLEAQVGDLEAIIGALDLRRVALLGYSQGGPISIAHTVQHPDNVSHLILYGTYHDGDSMKIREVTDAFMALIRADWGGYGGSAMLEVFIPGAPPAAREVFAEYQRQSADTESAIGTLVAALQYEITPLLPQVTAPTLVLHRRGDKACPFQQGRDLAARIPGARFVPLEGDVHVISLGDTEPLISAIEHFLGGQEGPRARPKVGEGLLTILFTDIEGSTALTQRLGDAKARELLREHERMVREALKAHGGSEVKTMGDGFMASFSSATKALECAVAVQRAFAQHNESAEEPIKVRVGLNAGEPIAEEEDLHGTAVIEAARITAAAAGGEILVANVVRELAKGKNFLFADRGETSLRGFEDPVRLYAVRWRE